MERFAGAFCIMSALSSLMPADAGQPCVSLMSLRHVGEQDAALPRIDFTTATTSAAVDRVLALRVTPSTYQALCQIAATGHQPAQPPTWRTGSFELSATGCADGTALPSHIEPETFLRMVDLIKAQARPPRATMASIDGIANIVRSANHLP